MAIAQLFFRKGNFIGSVELDVIISEGSSASARITKNPVEHGADINDHIIIDPMTFSMQGVVSDTKTNFVSSIQSLSELNTPSKDAWEQLLELQADRVPFELVTNIKTYPNVVIQTLTEVQDKDTSNGLFFSASLVEIILVGEDTKNAASFNDPNIADMAVSSVEGGQKSLGEI